MNAPSEFDPLRRCTKCEQSYPESSYRKGRSVCKECNRSQKRAWVKATVRYCTGCKKKRGRRYFDSDKRGTVCAYCLGKVKERPPAPAEHACKECHRMLGRDSFGESRWFRRVWICQDCKPLLHDVPVDDIQYDYAFAREVLGFGPAKALEWVTGGYRNQPEAIVRSVDPARSWEPDPLVAA